MKQNGKMGMILSAFPTSRHQESRDGLLALCLSRWQHPRRGRRRGRLWWGGRCRGCAGRGGRCCAWWTSSVEVDWKKWSSIIVELCSFTHGKYVYIELLVCRRCFYFCYVFMECCWMEMVAVGGINDSRSTVASVIMERQSLQKVLCNGWGVTMLHANPTVVEKMLQEFAARDSGCRFCSSCFSKESW